MIFFLLALPFAFSFHVMIALRFCVFAKPFFQTVLPYDSPYSFTRTCRLPWSDPALLGK
jgi:hypothetical protein